MILSYAARPYSPLGSYDTRLPPTGCESEWMASTHVQQWESEIVMLARDITTWVISHVPEGELELAPCDECKTTNSHYGWYPWKKTMDVVPRFSLLSETYITHIEPTVVRTVSSHIRTGKWDTKPIHSIMFIDWRCNAAARSSLVSTPTKITNLYRTLNIQYNSSDRVWVQTF